MKTLIAGRMDGWMGIYWEQFALGFQKNGDESMTHDSRGADPRGVVRKLLPGDAEERIRRKRTESLCKKLDAFAPDVLLVHSLRYDFPELRERFKGCIAYWDIDGPSGPFGDPELPQVQELDLFLTVSRPVLRRMREQDGDSVRIPTGYLPHGADIDFYSPGLLNAKERERFTAPMAFIGRPTERRAEHLAPLVDDGLALWGRRWQKKPWKNETFKPCIREKDNVVGDGVTAIYRATDLILNISREPFTDPPTTLNLQVFHVPATATCLLTERVEELEDAFDLETEVLSFLGVEEFAEKAKKYSRDREAAKQIGEAGRKRCAAHHSMQQRARQVVEFVGAL